MSRSKLVLAIVATDNTFERCEVRGVPAWVGRCIHCQTRLVVPEEGDASPDVTVEHIVPRNHGGTDDPSNLALACARCNAEKGMRHDNKRRDDRRRLEIEELLLARRRQRWRAPAP